MEEQSTTNAPYYGQEPKASPAVRPAMVVLSLVLLGASFVAGREVWRLKANPEAQSWTQPLIDLMSKEKLDPWMIYAGGVAVVVGLILLFIAVKPRKHTHVKVSNNDGPSTWMRHVDIARRSSAVAKTVPGVKSATTISKDKRVNISLSGDMGDPGLLPRVTHAVNAELQHLAAEPTVTVEFANRQEVDSNV